MGSLANAQDTRLIPRSDIVRDIDLVDISRLLVLDPSLSAPPLFLTTQMKTRLSYQPEVSPKF